MYLSVPKLLLKICPGRNEVKSIFIVDFLEIKILCNACSKSEQFRKKSTFYTIAGESELYLAGSPFTEGLPGINTSPPGKQCQPRKRNKILKERVRFNLDSGAVHFTD
jgi:hypothetical protein